MQEVDVVCPSYRLGKLYLPPQNSYTGLELELTRCNNDVRMYINVFSIPFTWNPCAPTTIELMVDIDGDCYSYQADCLQGGQRLLVPSEAANRIIDALVACKSVRIQAGRYSSEILCANFASLFSTF